MPGSDILSLVGVLAVIVLVLLLAYFSTRLVGRYGQMGGIGARTTTRNIKILEQAVLGRDQRLLVAQVGTRCFCLGATPSGITVLAELSEEEAKAWQPPEAGTGGAAPPSFREALLSQFKSQKKP